MAWIDPDGVTIYDEDGQPIGMLSVEERAEVLMVYNAWNDPGPHPAYHRDAQRHLLSMWPKLGRALDRLTVREAKIEERSNP
jgi:hypothetical protein